MMFDVQNAIVYLVDDDFAIRDSLTILIESNGLKVICFDSAKAFLDSYTPGQPGCLLLDVIMPLMGGLELQKELSERNIRIPIIFISGNAEISDSAKAFRSGAVDFIEKPFDNNLLMARIHEAIAKDIEDRRQLHERNKIKACFESLTAREKQVLSLIIDCHSKPEAAIDTAPDYSAMASHDEVRIMEKMQAENLAGLVEMIMSHSLFPESRS